MISVVIPALDAERTLPACLEALIPAAVAGIVREVIVADGGSSDRTVAVADAAGCRIVQCSKPGRGSQLIEGVAATRSAWLLILHADTVLEDGWFHEAESFMARIARADLAPSAAAFRFALLDEGIAPRIVEAGVALRCRLLKRPFGDQGLLLPRALYDEIGGYPAVPLMEDVMLISALPRSRRILLRTRAFTSAAKYRRRGYFRRVLRNWLCLTLYGLGVSVATIDRLYRR